MLEIYNFLEIYIQACMSECGYVHMIEVPLMASGIDGHKQAVVCHLIWAPGTKLRFSGREENALSHSLTELSFQSRSTILITNDGAKRKIFSL